MPPLFQDFQKSIYMIRQLETLVQTDNIKKTWTRYLDDSIIIWNKEILDLEAFHELLNNIDPDIKFTIEESEPDISFLEICITYEGDSLSTDIYYKPTDTQRYLHFNSYHPRHTKRSIPYNLARRICTIVSDEKKRNQCLEEMKKYLRKQGYPLILFNYILRYITLFYDCFLQKA